MKRKYKAGSSITVIPNYMQYWIESKPWGQEIRIVNDNDEVMVIECRWAEYRRPRDVQDLDRLS
jgi:hypothetical protein